MSIAYWVEKSGSMATMLCVGSAKPGGRSASVPGNAGAPALVGFRREADRPRVAVALDGVLVQFSSGGSYMIPEDARSTVRASSSIDQENPTRGAKLFLSTLKLDDSGLAANGRASGTLKRS